MRKPVVFGSHEPKTLAQLADVAARAERAALMADGHLGYVMPIGGVTAYRDRVSVVGVGFDIACLAAGSPVSLTDGSTVSVEQVPYGAPLSCWDGVSVRMATPVLGTIVRGRRQVLWLTLANGRRLGATPDHRLLTRGGWIEACSAVGREVAVRPFVGLPNERSTLPIDLVRVLAYTSGDGHLTKDGKRVSIYTTVEEDASAIVGALMALGVTPRTYRRRRNPEHETEIRIDAGSVDLHRRLRDLGSPAGKKQWPSEPMPWLFDEPEWVRAQFLSAFFSAEMSTPRLSPAGWMPNLAVKQADRNALAFIGRLLDSFGYESSITKSATWALQVLGGYEESLRLMEEIGFCYARNKRIASARCCAGLWACRVATRSRDVAKSEARRLVAAGVGYGATLRRVSQAYGVTESFVHHAIYDARGPSRMLAGQSPAMETSGEVVWVPVVHAEATGEASVFDVGTGDSAESFLASGVVVHNCGNCAVLTDRRLGELSGSDLTRIADEIESSISFGVGRRNQSDDAPVDHPLFEDPAWEAIPDRTREDLRAKARAQLGTVGSGNHYVDVLADEHDRLWIGVHFGSRGLGHTIASGFLALSQGREWGERVPEVEALLDLLAPLGHDYFALMELAGRYAYAGREWVARKAVSILGGTEEDLVHNNHNFGWREIHDGEELIVVRKGATPAFPGQRGFVGGSMGDDSVILRGSTDPAALELQKAALFSTVHGAGRVMSRSEAAGKLKRRKVWVCGQRECGYSVPIQDAHRGGDGSFPRCARCGSKMHQREKRELVRAGKVTPEMMASWLRERGVILRGGGLDESPHAYRRLPDVLAAQGATIEIEHTLRPVIVVMAGADEFDPYQD